MVNVPLSEVTARYDAGRAKAEAHGHEVRAKIQAQSDLRKVELELMKARAALKESRDISNSWKASMEAWQDLAKTLRDEIKNCPNNDAHKFGKDRSACVDRFDETQNRHRNTYGLKPFDLNKNN